jgi:RHS repeat-associated protein
MEPEYLWADSRIKYGDYTSIKGQVSFGYDTFLRLSSILSNEGTPALNITLTRDFSGNILSKEGNTYTYDGMNRLVDGEGESTDYDELSNLSARGTKRYTYQDAGTGGKNQMRLESFFDGANTFSYGYDNNGNIASISNRFSSLVYDALNRLREVGFSGSARLDRYWYDIAGLRVKREERINIDANTTKIYSIYSGDNPLVQEKYVGSTRVSTRFNIIDGGQILAQYEYVYGAGEAVRYFYLDQIGSRRVVKDASGTVREEFSYSAWGQYTQTQGTQVELASYTGKEYDGTGLLYFNARYYDPSLGRFVTEDPSRKGANWYAYCENNPLNNIDPTGNLLAKIEDRLLATTVSNMYDESLTFRSYINGFADEPDMVFQFINAKTINKDALGEVDVRIQTTPKGGLSVNTIDSEGNLVDTVISGNQKRFVVFIKIDVEKCETRAVEVGKDIESVLNVAISQEVGHAFDALRLGYADFLAQGEAESSIPYESGLRPSEIQADEIARQILSETGEINEQ